jgi:hypothetical protein
MDSFKPRSDATAVAGRVQGDNESSCGAGAPAGAYRTPRLFAIGRAEDLMQGGTGNFRDSRNWFLC